jgi:hypothetical protein
MKTHSPFRELVAAGCALLTISNLFAGWSTGRVAEQTSAVPISVVTEVELARSGTQTLDDILKLAPAVLPAGTRTTLRGHPGFASLTDPDVDIKFNAINTLALESIEVLRVGDEALGTGLLGMYLNQRVSIGVGGVVNLIAETRHDGSSRVADDAINLYWLPNLTPGATTIKLYEPDGFQLMNILGRQGCLAMFDGYHGPQPQSMGDEALFNQALFNQAYSCGQLEVARISATLDVMDGIAANLTLPENAFGVAAGIGRDLLRDDSLSDQEKRDSANLLRGYLAGSYLPIARQQLDYHELAATVSGLVLDNKFSGIGSASEPLKLASTWNYSLPQSMGEFNLVTVLGGGGTIDQTDPQNPLVLGNNGFWQIGGRADGSTLEEQINIEDVDYLVGASRWDDKLLVAGYSLNSLSTKFYAYTDSDADGRVETGTRQLLFDTPMFSQGLHLNWNRGRDELYALDLGTRDLYQLDMFNGLGLPTSLTGRGGLGDRYQDVTKVDFSTDGKWAVGYLGYGLALQPHTFTLEARYTEADGGFRPIRESFRYEEVKLNPAVAETPWAGSLGIRATYTPNEIVAIEKWTGGTWDELGSAQTDPYGRAILELSEPFAAGGKYRFTSEDRMATSPTYVAPPMLSGPLLLNPKLRRDRWFRATSVFEPESDIEVEWKVGLNLEWSSGGVKTTPMIGAVDHKIDVTGINSAVMRAQVVEKPPVLRPEYFALPPVAIFALYPGWNDFFRYGAAFEPSRLQDVNNPYLAIPGMGSFTSRLFMYANRNGPISFEYKFTQGLYTGLLNAMVVVPEIAKVIRPPVEYNELGEEVVYIKCLIIGGNEYPVFQFKMIPPDNCLFIHWHSPAFPRVYHLDDDFAGIVDPDPSFCGYGTIYELAVEPVEVLLDDWLDFTDAFLPASIAASGIVTPAGGIDDPLCAPVIR